MSFDDLLKSLREDYLASIPEKVTRIKAQVDSAATDEVRDSFHKLKGTGRTYGLPEVSDLAAVVESICVSAPQNAIQAAGQALPILADLHSAHLHGLDFNLERDPRYQQIRRLLANK